MKKAPGILVRLQPIYKDLILLFVSLVERLFSVNRLLRGNLLVIQACLSHYGDFSVCDT